MHLFNNMFYSSKAHERSSIKTRYGFKRNYLQSSDELESSQDEPESNKKTHEELTEIEEDPLSLPEQRSPEPTRPPVFLTPKPCRFCLADVNQVGGMKIKDFGFHRLKHWIAQHTGFLVNTKI
jgi:hypothetical protein